MTFYLKPTTKIEYKIKEPKKVRNYQVQNSNQLRGSTSLLVTRIFLKPHQLFLFNNFGYKLTPSGLYISLHKSVRLNKINHWDLKATLQSVILNTPGLVTLMAPIFTRIEWW